MKTDRELTSGRSCITPIAYLAMSSISIDAKQVPYKVTDAGILVRVAKAHLFVINRNRILVRQDDSLMIIVGKATIEQCCIVDGIVSFPPQMNGNELGPVELLTISDVM